MRLTEPRVTPLPESEWTEEQRRYLQPYFDNKRSTGVATTLARHWDASKHLWGSHIMGDTLTLSPRERELLILRTGWLCKAEYEWGRHVLFARKAGLGDDEIARIKVGSSDPAWTAFDATLLRAADELHARHIISNGTWAALASRYDTKQLMDVVFTVGQYTAICMALNSFGVRLEAGVAGF